MKSILPLTGLINAVSKVGCQLAHGPFSKQIRPNTNREVSVGAWGRRSPEASTPLWGIKITKWPLKIQINQVLTLSRVYGNHTCQPMCPGLHLDYWGLRGRGCSTAHGIQTDGAWLQQKGGDFWGRLGVFGSFSLVVFPFTKKLTMNSHWACV